MGEPSPVVREARRLTCKTCGRAAQWACYQWPSDAAYENGAPWPSAPALFLCDRCHEGAEIDGVPGVDYHEALVVA